MSKRAIINTVFICLGIGAVLLLSMNGCDGYGQRHRDDTTPPGGTNDGRSPSPGGVNPAPGKDTAPGR